MTQKPSLQDIKPLLAETIPYNDETLLDKLPYPLAATYKVDGIRALKIHDSMKSRSLKPIKNARINALLSDFLPEGADGEIYVGKTFQETTSAVMSSLGSANFTDQVSFYWFDWVRDGNLNEKYMDRIKAIQEFMTRTESPPSQLCIVPLFPIIIHNKEDLLTFESEALNKGYEGVMLRKLDSPYKCGRSTFRQAFLLKLKRFQDDEATVVGFEELLHNENEQVRDERGFARRSSKKENKVPAETLGALIVQNKEGIEFKIGTGFNEEQRHAIWNNKDKYIAKMVKYKYFAEGMVNAPRHPVFIGFRDADDTS